MIIYLMGVSGCGKTTIGNELAKRICCEYFEADQFHSVENRTKMANGIPLTDYDRQPWLTSIAGMQSFHPSIVFLLQQRRNNTMQLDILQYFHVLH